MPDNQLQRQLGLRFLSVWYYTRRGGGILARKKSVCKLFNHLKSIEKPNIFWLYLPESPPRLCPRPQAAKNDHFAITFSLIKPNLSQCGHQLKCLDKSQDRVWHACLLLKLKSYGISGQVFGLIFSFLSIRWLWVVLVWKSSQEYPVRFRQGSFLGLTRFLLYDIYLPEDVICKIAMYADDTTLISRFDQASDL